MTGNIVIEGDWQQSLDKFRKPSKFSINKFFSSEIDSLHNNQLLDRGSKEPIYEQGSSMREGTYMTRYLLNKKGLRSLVQ